MAGPGKSFNDNDNGVDTTMRIKKVTMKRTYEFSEGSLVDLESINTSDPLRESEDDLSSPASFVRLSDWVNSDLSP